jgi:hypothetical protein
VVTEPLDETTKGNIFLVGNKRKYYKKKQTERGRKAERFQIGKIRNEIKENKVCYL